jgi:hypothetical protein
VERSSAVTIRYSFAAILILLSLGLAACGGKGQDTGTAVPETASPEVGGEPTATAGATATGPAGGFTVSGNLFESQDKGYSVRFPEGWTPDPDFLTGPGFSVDAFFATAEVGGLKPNLAVTCDTLSERTDLRGYFDKKVEIARKTAGVQPEISSLEVAGQEALMSRVERQTPSPPLVKTEVVFFGGRCAWTVDLTAPLGGQADYEGLFSDFLQSFRLLP